MNRLGRGDLNDQVDADRLLDQLGLDDEEIQWRKEFVGFEQEDVERITDFDDIFREQADELADRFYNHLTDYEQTREIIDRSPKSIDQLKQTQKAYLTTLASGEYDQTYFTNRARIGKLHDLLDMPMKQYIGQYNVYYRLFFELTADRIRDRLAESIEAEPFVDTAVDTERLVEALSEDVEESIAELQSLFKLLTLDMQVAVDTYIQSHVNDIEAQRDRFAALFRNVPTPVVVVRITDDGPRVKKVNTAFEELFGYTVEDLADRDLEKYLSPPGEEPRSIEHDRAVDDIQNDSESGFSEVEITLETQFGRREFLRVSAPVDQGGDALEYAFYIDVTDQKQRQERLQVLSRVLRHDIRNKLNVITGCASVCRDYITAEDCNELLDFIDQSADDLLSKSQQIRHVEEMVAGQAERQSMDLVATTRDAFDTLEEQYPKCEFELSAESPINVRGMKPLRIAVTEIIENAAKHNDSASPRVEVSIVEGLDEKYASLRVADNGPGIPPEEYKVLTGERDRSPTYHSTGLGLWTVNWIVTRIGGSIHFTANSPRGSIVTLRLPRYSTDRKQPDMQTV